MKAYATVSLTLVIHKNIISYILLRASSELYVLPD